MKKLATLVFALLLTGSLAFAQAGTGTTKTDDTTKSDTGKKGKSGKKHHKGGKKSKKGATETTPAPAPK